MHETIWRNWLEKCSAHDQLQVQVAVALAIAAFNKGDRLVTAAYIEHRPKSTDPKATTTHHVIVVNGAEIGTFKTQKEAKDKACNDGYRPVHVARERHLQDRDKPDHWRKDPC